MFNRYEDIDVNVDTEQIARSIASLKNAQDEANRISADQVATEKEKLKFEKETKDRADISLKEYEQLKADLEYWKKEAEQYKAISRKIISPLLNQIDYNKITENDISKIINNEFECEVFVSEHAEQLSMTIGVLYKVKKGK